MRRSPVETAGGVFQLREGKPLPRVGGSLPGHREGRAAETLQSFWGYLVMANQAHAQVLAEGTEALRRWRAENPGMLLV